MSAEAPHGSEPDVPELDRVLVPGARVGGLTLGRRLAHGGSGVVFEARDDRGDACALKVLAQGTGDPRERVARLQREARILRELQHPNIVPLRAEGVLDDGRAWLAFPLLRGDTLRALVRAHPQGVEGERAWRLLRPIVAALAAAHARGVIHRDVKPENIFLSDVGAGEPVPVLLDFGLAKDTTRDDKLTGTGIPLGTAAYMSPEQWWNESPGPATDQYALGVTLFELLLGAPPFDAAPFVALMQEHLSRPAPTLASRGREVSPAVESLLARTLAKSPSERFASLTELLSAGDLAFGYAPALAVPTRSRARGGWGVAWAACVPALVCLLGYRHAHDPRYYVWIGGFGIYPVVVAALAGFVSLLRAARSGRAGPRSIALLPALFGCLGTLLGWGATVAHLGHFRAVRQFELFHQGLAEANVLRYLGFSLTAGLLTASLALEPDGAATTGPRVRDHTATLILGVLALVGLVTDVRGGFLVCALAACAHGLSPARVASRLPRVLRGVIALAGALAASARVDARAHASWEDSLNRAYRVQELLAAWAERDATLAFALAALLVTAVHGALSRSGSPVSIPRRTAVPFAVLAALCALFDTTFLVGTALQRRAIWASLAPQFADSARLDPPTAPELPLPTPAPSLRLARDVVVLDDARIGTTLGLSSEAGLSALGLDLSHRLARAVESEGSGVPLRLQLVVDRGLPWSLVLRVITLARSLGVTELSILYALGGAPRLEPRAPPEASYTLPKDYGALLVGFTASANAGLSFPGNMLWGEVARALLAHHQRGEVSLRVAP